MNQMREEPLTPEEFGAILWPGMFQPGWRDQDSSSAFFQAECYCLEKATAMLEIIEVRRKTKCRTAAQLSSSDPDHRPRPHIEPNKSHTRRYWRC